VLARHPLVSDFLIAFAWALPLSVKRTSAIGLCGPRVAHKTARFDG
jgi:hypothetical protein